MPDAFPLVDSGCELGPKAEEVERFASNEKPVQSSLVAGTPPTRVASFGLLNAGVAAGFAFAANLAAGAPSTCASATTATGKRHRGADSEWEG
jgi:hypothetical protein